MFQRRTEIRKRLLRLIEKFREKGAVSSDKAMSIEELNLPPKFKELMKGRLGRLGIFVEVDGKYYLSEERLKEVKEQHLMFEHPPHPWHPPRPFKRWIRHTACVPKGFLRYYVVKLLKEKPMSGSEIMEEIERETGGRWKPSPGSVYPLLAWLQDDGYTKELPTEEGGIKRYKLTEKGERFFEEQIKLEERLRKKLEFLAPLPFGGFWFSFHPEKLQEIQEPARRFTRALFNLKIALQENLTEQALKEVKEFLNSTAERIEEISKKIKEGK